MANRFQEEGKGQFLLAKVVGFPGFRPCFFCGNVALKNCVYIYVYISYLQIGRKSNCLKKINKKRQFHWMICLFY